MTLPCFWTCSMAMVILTTYDPGIELENTLIIQEKITEVNTHSHKSIRKQDQTMEQRKLGA